MIDPEDYTGKNFWQEIDKRAPYVAIEKCEEAARQLISLTTLLMTVFFGIFSLNDILQLKVSGTTVLWFISPFILLLVSLILATQVIMPRRYKFLPAADSQAAHPEAEGDLIRSQYIQIRDKKHLYLRSSYLFLILSMVVVLITALIYLLQ
jgi:hypothetical protein